MVIRGGENIYPREIEEFLYRHPEVQDVQVVGVPDAKYGEELCAWIIAEARRERDAGRGARVLQGPDRALQDAALHRFVDGFPTTVTGKMQKFKMREAMIARIGPVTGKDRMRAGHETSTTRSRRNFQPPTPGRHARPGRRPARAVAKVAAGGGEAARASATRRAASCCRATAWSMLLDPGTPFLEIAPLAALRHVRRRRRPAPA